MTALASPNLRVIDDVSGTRFTDELSSRNFSTLLDKVILPADTPVVVTIPHMSSDRIAVFFTFDDGANVWVLPSATPTIAFPPGAAGTVTRTTQELNPNGARLFGQGEQFQLLTSQTGVQVSISYYGIN